MSQRALIAALAVLGAVAVALAVALGVVLTQDGDEDSDAADAGAEACETYRAAVADAPEAITPYDAMPEIVAMLEDLDTPTRTAFAALIAADDTNPFTPGADPNATRDAAAEVRAVCLAEHGVKIAG